MSRLRQPPPHQRIASMDTCKKHKILVADARLRPASFPAAPSPLGASLASAEALRLAPPPVIVARNHAGEANANTNGDGRACPGAGVRAVATASVLLYRLHPPPGRSPYPHSVEVPNTLLQP